MREGRSKRGRVILAATAAACVAGALGLAMAPAQAEATSKTVTLTLTGMQDSTCTISTGGTTAYIAPGGTVTLKASLAGLVVKGISITSSKVASFVDKVVINGDTRHPHYLKKTTDKIVLSGIRSTTSVQWTASAVVLHGLLGDYTVPLNGADAHVPAGGNLSWSGHIVPKSNSNCGIAVTVPTVKAHVGPVHVKVPGTTVRVPNVLPKLKRTVGHILHKVQHQAPGSKSGNKPTGNKKGAPGPNVNYTPPPVTVPEEVMPHAVAFGGSGFPAPMPGSADYGIQAPGAGSSGSGSSSGHGAVTTPDAHPANKTVDLGSRGQLGGPQLPIVLAIAAILALVAVTGWYAKLILLRRN